MKKLQLLGEFDCKIDAKGRMRVPSDLIKQLEEEGSTDLVINRGFEGNLMLYPKSVWEKMTQVVNQLNQYEPKNRAFIRQFYRGAQVLELDSSDRILIKKPLLEYAHIGKEVKIFAQGEQIELWDANTYNNMFDNDPANFSDLAKAVLGDSNMLKPEE